MATIAPNAIEAQAEYTSSLEAEVQSYVDELAEVRLENEALKLQLQRLMTDRSMAV